MDNHEEESEAIGLVSGLESFKVALPAIRIVKIVGMTEHTLEFATVDDYLGYEKANQLLGGGEKPPKNKA